MKSIFMNLKRWVAPPPKLPIYRSVESPHRLVMTKGCLTGLVDCLAPEKEKKHEGIAYLVGQTDDKTTLAVCAIRPDALTTSGSFHVSQLAMVKVVRQACNAGLKIIGQVHTHPGQAFHSDGDVEGARIAYPGYISIVLPEYGRYLPSFHAAAIYAYVSHEQGFIDLDPADITIISERL